MQIYKKEKAEFYDKWKELKPLSKEISQEDIDEAIENTRKHL